MLSAAELVCDYQDKVDIEYRKRGRINFNTTLPSFICMLKDQKTYISRSWRFYPITHLLHLNEKYQNPILQISAFKCFDQTQFWRVRGMSHFTIVKVGVI